jgi:hypothetical protein
MRNFVHHRAADFHERTRFGVDALSVFRRSPVLEPPETVLENLKSRLRGWPTGCSPADNAGIERRISTA